MPVEKFKYFFFIFFMFQAVQERFNKNNIKKKTAERLVVVNSTDKKQYTYTKRKTLFFLWITLENHFFLICLIISQNYWIISSNRTKVKKFYLLFSFIWKFSTQNKIKERNNPRVLWYTITLPHGKTNNGTHNTASSSVYKKIDDSA